MSVETFTGNILINKVHLDLCSSQDDTAANYPQCDCAAVVTPVVTDSAPADEEFCEWLRHEGYAEGRFDERKDCMRLLNWAYRKLSPFTFPKQEDALMLDEIKLMQMSPADCFDSE